MTHICSDTLQTHYFNTLAIHERIHIFLWMWIFSYWRSLIKMFHKVIYDLLMPMYTFIELVQYYYFVSHSASIVSVAPAGPVGVSPLIPGLQRFSLPGTVLIITVLFIVFPRKRSITLVKFVFPVEPRTHSRGFNRMLYHHRRRQQWLSSWHSAFWGAGWKPDKQSLFVID